ncbi:MAG: hypothetical protein RRB13_02790 [bacterium]|nr:hypothetical protein [bacterium]
MKNLYFWFKNAAEKVSSAASDSNTLGYLWAQQAYLKAPNADSWDAFGTKIAIDADTAVVGSQAEDSIQQTITNATTASADNSAPDAGAAYVFVRSGTTWTQEAYLKAPNTEVQVTGTETNDQFGAHVDLTDGTGTTLIVGTPYDNSNQTTITNGSTASTDNSLLASGAAYIFYRGP